MGELSWLGGEYQIALDCQFHQYSLETLLPEVSIVLCPTISKSNEIGGIVRDGVLIRYAEPKSFAKLIGKIVHSIAPNTEGMEIFVNQDSIVRFVATANAT